MQASGVTVILPLGREQDLPGAVDCLLHQTAQPQRVVVVENGEAVGACLRFGFVPNMLLTSATGTPGIPKNAGLRWLRRHGGGFFACVDSDDYYGPNYLRSVIGASGLAEVVGKSSIYVRTAAGSMRLFVYGGESQLVSAVNGPTICGWAEDALDFDEGMQCSEDSKWVAQMIAMGAKVRATSRHDFMYRRFPPEHGHALTATDWQMAQCTKAPVFDVGPEDLDVVNGIRPEPVRTLVPKRPFRVWDHPGWIRSIEHGQEREDRQKPETADAR